MQFELESVSAMLVFLFFVFIAIRGGRASICPTDFEDGGNELCYRPFDVPATRGAAIGICNRLGATLATAIPDLSANNDLQNFALSNNQSSIWLGIICLNSSIESCKLEGIEDSNLTYHNFAPGFPNLSSGPWVFMNVSNGLWFSTGFANLPFICQVPKGDPIPFCTFGYSLFRSANTCYKPTIATNFTTQQSLCEKESAIIPSLNSRSENQFISRSLSFPTRYVRLGLFLKEGQLTWLDGTSFNSSEFTGFGLFNPLFGNCVSMLVSGFDLVSFEQWISSSCNTPLPSVCKKDALFKYNSISQPRATASCSNPMFLQNEGTIFSPNDSIQCVYLLMVDSGVVHISFTELNLFRGSISLFNEITDSRSFATINSFSSPGVTFNSTGRFMKMVFRAHCRNCDPWMAYFY